MPDYQKLFTTLFNEITKTIEALEKVREDVFDEFVSSDPSREEVASFMSNIELKSNPHYKMK